MNIESARIMDYPPFIRVHDAKTYFGMGSREAWALLAKKVINGCKTSGNQWKIESASIIKYYKKRMSIKEDQE